MISEGRRLAESRAGGERMKPQASDVGLRRGIAVIHYREKEVGFPEGRDKSWSIGCLIGVDNEESIKAHLRHWVPNAEFIRVEFKSKAGGKE